MEFAPCIFWLFPNVKLGLKDECFASIEVNVTATFRVIPIDLSKRFSAVTIVLK